MTKAERKRVAGELRRWGAGHDIVSELSLRIYSDASTRWQKAYATWDEVDLHILSVAEAVEQGCWP